MAGGTFGGMSPWPLQFGGGQRPLELLTQSLNDSRGAYLDTTTWSSPAAIENRAFARFLQARWNTNTRAQAQFDPSRCTDTLPRWERIYSIFPLPSDTDGDRRIRLTFKWAQASKRPWYQQIVDDLTTKMGAVFVQLVHTPSSEGQAIYPGGPNTNPYDVEGTTDSTSWSHWSSAVGHIAMQVQVPIGMSVSDFSAAVNEGLMYLDGALPSWNTFSWFVEEGFYLDQQNLAWQALDS